MAVRIVTDSSSDLPAELARQWDVTVVPCYVTIDDMTYRDGVDLSAGQFYDKLTSRQRLPTTSQPSVADFQEVYRELIGQEHQIISIHLSAKLSGTLNSAQQAKSSLGGDPPIKTIDSRLAASGLGLVVLEAAKQARQEKDYKGLAQRVQDGLEATQVFFALDTLDYLHKGGRIGKAQAFLGSLLNVKPILTLRDGEVHPVERQRNLERSVRRMVELVRPLAPVKRLMVCYSTEPMMAEGLREQLSDLLPVEEIVISRFGPTLGTYIGPKALGIAVTSAR